MFHYDRGLKLTKANLAVDFRRRQKCGFISHAHIDHMARHEHALCTPATGRLYQFRFGARPTIDLPYRVPYEFGGLRLTTLPAGHCLGSAMLLAEDGDQSLLYTGDFKLSESATAERAELPRAKILVIESTYGDPRYRLTPRGQAIAQLIELVQQTLARDAVPVIQAYVLGKAQEVTKILTDAGIPVLQHQQIYGISKVYEACGVALGRHGLLTDTPADGHAVVVPPRQHRLAIFHRRRPCVTFAVTGWAMDASTQRRWDVDHAIPLSDHADYDDLFAAIEQVQPQEIYCTHGPVSFVDRLREAGLNAFPLDGQACQLRLF
ncbi:MAG TPA: MBL fold metallo-hydrolase RNA specificity domain-containing protein [Pirellulales bacterium]|nr:MBL fold metallo-hydrolase RNA specificity domain-containing protein [Pirellulales bacterium]